MAGRIRSIKPEILDDEPAAALSDTAWRLWVSSWLLADDHGRFRAGARYLAANVWQDTGRTEAAEEAIGELARAKFIRLYVVEGQRYAEIKQAGWKRHQRIDHPGKPRVPVPGAADYIRPPSKKPRSDNFDLNDSDDLGSVSRNHSDDVTRPDETGREPRESSPLAGARGTMVGGPGPDLGPDPSPPPEPVDPDTHIARAREAPGQASRSPTDSGAPSAADPRVARLRDFFKASGIAVVARSHPDGDRAALREMGEHLLGVCDAKAVDLEVMLETVKSAHFDARQELGQGMTWAALAKKVRQYASRAKKPAETPPNQGPRAPATHRRAAAPVQRGGLTVEQIDERQAAKADGFAAAMLESAANGAAEVMDGKEHGSGEA